MINIKKLGILGILGISMIVFNLAISPYVNINSIVFTVVFYSSVAGLSLSALWLINKVRN